MCVDLAYPVQEEKSPGTYIGDIAADSQLLNSVSSQDHNLITFNQLSQKETSQLFNISKSGKLFTSQKLDAESLCSYSTECSRTIKVAVKQAETFIKILKIKVTIEDVNDHQPEFPVKQIKLLFDESHGKGTAKSIPNAVDQDVGIMNSKISYRLKKHDNEPFRLSVSKKVDGTSKLRISLDEKLDRESKDSYFLQLVAEDGGFPSQHGILNIEVSVIDVNDNPPIFSKDIYNVSIKNTHHRASPVTVLSATDLDSGDNGKIIYHFSSKTSEIVKNSFQLNNVTGEIFFLNVFPVTQTRKYKLFVEATDRGSPPLSSIVLLLVNVINQQNRAPEIDVNFVSALKKNTAAISERIKVGSFIAYVSVIDNDVGLNGEVTCDLKSDKFQLLKISSKEYKVLMKNTVDRETESNYNISIICHDKGSPALKTARKFSIQVMDVNDVQPKFTKDTFKFLTYENEKSNFPVGFINATDLDLGNGGQLTYFIIDNNNMFPFQITDYGFISTIRSLDRERRDIYKFRVLVKDNGTPSLNSTANVVVEVMDENDNAPYFTFPSVNPFSLDVHYHPQSKNDITTLRASDRDSRENAFLKYEMLDRKNHQLFTVNPYTGVLSFARKVYQNDAGSYNLLLVVKDSGSPVLSATTTLSLTLTVSNRTSPMLTAAHIQSSDMIDINLVIIIVVTAVVISIAIVVIITICIVRCNRRRTMLHTAAMNPAMQPGREKCLMISQSNNPFAITQNPEEGVHHSTPSMRSRRDFCPEQELPVEWTTLTTPKSIPASTQACIQEVGGTSGRIQGKRLPSPDYYRNNVSMSRKYSHRVNKNDTSPYEEIPVLPLPTRKAPYF
uniref:Cadherin domain-containing protein n=2 Tax=Octopus bimaculoides TaxID=37653 RepID=A0A0L8GDS1_OCTBM